MSKLVELLPLAPNVQAALVSGAGSLGKALACARAYESAIFHEAHYPGVSPQLIRAAYLDAVYGSEQALMAA
jgi:c-di-GMP-related signal transduction protein